MPISRREFTSLSLTVGAAVTFATTSATATNCQPLAPASDSIGGAHRQGLVVPEHVVPTPSTISPQAQAFLSHAAPVGAIALPTSRDDKDAWRAYKEAGERGMVMLTKPYAQRYPGTVVTHDLGAFKVYEVTPKNVAPQNSRRAIVYVHGGGFIVGGGEAAIYPAMQMAGLAKTKVYSIDYRLGPEFSFPVPLDDTVDGYRFVLGRHKPECVALFGPSAGANLVPACVLKARDLGLPLPAACALHSSPSDLARDGDSFYTNYVVDIVLKERPSALSQFYANGHDLKDPLLSPVYGDYSKGFPPTVLTSGTRDILLSPTVLLHRAMLRGGVKAELHVWEAMTHAPFFNAPEEDELYQQHVSFMLEHMKS